MKVTIKGKGTTVTLDQRHFLARGGEGAIYAKDDTVYKVCESGKMIPEGKFKELAALNDPRIIRPMDIFTTDKGEDGYTMKFVDDTYALCQIFPVAFRNRNGVTPDTMLKLVREMQDGIQYVHKQRCLIVDLNELNFLVKKALDKLYFIDVNSYKTPSYQPTAIMPSIRDPHCGNSFSELTDWYSFAIVSFMMFIGMHPYKGKHPKFSDPKTSMLECMKHNLWIGNPDVKYPKGACLTFDVIPEAYLNWYKAVLGEGKRVPPPSDLVAFINVVTQKIKQVVGSNNFLIDEVFSTAADIVKYYNIGGKDVIISQDTLYYDHRTHYHLPVGDYKLGATPTTQRPIAAWIEGQSVKLWDVVFQKEIPFMLNGDGLMVNDGRIYVKNGMRVVEVIFTELPGNLLASPHQVNSVMERATTLYDGCIIQNLFDAHYVSLFPETKQCRQFALRELDGYKVVDAKYESRVLMVMAVNQASGAYDRFVFRFAKDWSGFDVRVVKDVTNMGLNFTVLDNGVCASITEQEKLELFRAEKDAQGIKEFDDPAIEADMILTHKGAQTLFYRGKKLYSITVSKKP